MTGWKGARQYHGISPYYAEKGKYEEQKKIFKIPSKEV